MDVTSKAWDWDNFVTLQNISLTYCLTSQKSVDWVAVLPGWGEDKYGHLRLLIWGFGGIFHANYGANEGVNKITNNFLKYAIKIETWGLDTK